MAAMTKAMCVALIAAVMVAAAAPGAEAALGCGSVISYLSPCLPYVTNRGPLGGCCNGVKGLYGAARSTPDRQAACNCLKSLAATSGNINLSKAAGLPKQCNVNIPYQISPSTDCTKVR
ncbi:non-specific lipid-transfer protein 2-like [Salvia miltiorrhiza]|uniref:Non-specific lipid-transfer protein n=1 Tax=Salvia miltiorrhiza TaxID=226208 RepID=A5Y6Z8_SALMI|nr:non-specific lipid-transfer protein 2-like [Salvia miltiorrhiza]XP_057804437.1 non-specific lipid-transfer protein 2-like [Salvia miltiorrhiza]ABP01768.1 lipid transfer protein 1 [Salvia miltiorrhiza]